ncbi:hypothetical protein MLD38_037375 [Melastoma candidum]|uniref:Uncharacterized protein n=1 Tax=Melastoma candidum TaxID=119954 RepID=A0ACB9LMI6_9MYRT|nr:hypothetical protein MLD38_037375 [Melastoma candidum]
MAELVVVIPGILIGGQLVLDSGSRGRDHAVARQASGGPGSGLRRQHGKQEGVVSHLTGQLVEDVDIRQRKNDCYADVESGLWGWQCKPSAIAKENCVLKCLSPACYELVYESDPLEEDEKDFIRGQEYRYCLQKSSMGESLTGIKGAFDF